MTCEKCGHILFYLYDDLLCPKCEKLSIVPYSDSIKITEHFISYLNELIENELKNYSKYSLIITAFWEREKHIRNFNNNYGLLDLDPLLSYNLLMRRIIQMNNFSDKKTNPEKIKKLIKTFGTFSRLEEFRQSLESRTWSLLYMKKYDLKRLDDLSLTDVHYCSNENYDRIERTFLKHNIVSKSKGEKLIQEWGMDVDLNVKKFSRYLSPRETISIFYELMSMLYVIFFKNKLYVEAFGFFDSNKSTINPITLKKIAESYPVHDDALSTAKLDEFTAFVITKLGGKYKEFFQNFVLSEENPSAIPLFFKFNDLILISQAFSNLFHYALLAFVHKNEFNDETERRSKIFELNIVKNHFENKGYRYITDYKIKNKMQIDGIAISDSQVYVIEVKGWSSKRLIEEKTTKNILERDIKNAIDGFHFVRKSNKNRKTVSLPKKVNQIRTDRIKLKISENAKIEGMLVINESPTLNEYNGCKIVFVDDFLHIKS
ncbi:MAG: NERD domain-containing protein [Thaumarchaeota archaeon]|nr:NERD domain-containing protein [Nitrososphaerota archaeon]